MSNNSSAGDSQHALRTGIVATLVLLALLCIAWETLIAPLRPGAWIMALKALPVVLALPGIRAGKLKTFQWWSMLILAYLAEGLVRGASDTGVSATLGWVEAVLAGAAFVGILVYCKNAKAAAAANVRPG